MKIRFKVPRLSSKRATKTKKKVTEVTINLFDFLSEFSLGLPLILGLIGGFIGVFVRYQMRAVQGGVGYFLTFCICAIACTMIARYILSSDYSDSFY